MFTCVVTPWPPASPQRQVRQQQRLCCASTETALLDWLRDAGLPEQAVALKNDLAVTGRGLVATTALRRGTALLSVPASLVLSRERAVQDAPRSLRAAAEQLPEWSALALFLAAVRASPVPSHWSTYFASLPHFTGGLIDWQPGAAARLLMGTTLCHVALSREAEVDSAIRDILSLDGVAAAGVTHALLRWAFNMLFSRLIRLPSQNDTLALVPWADLMNHDVNCGAHLDWDGNAKAVVLRTDCEYAARQQVFCSYGPRSNGELLISYGFCPPANDRNAAATLHLRLAEDDPMRQAKAEALTRAGLRDEELFEVRLSGLDQRVVPYATLLAARPRTAGELDALAQRLFAPTKQQGGFLKSLFGGSTHTATALDAAHEAAATELLLRTVRSALADADAAQVAAAPGKQAAQLKRSPQAALAPSQARRLQAAVESIRATERKVLQRTEFVLRSQLRSERGSIAA
jgi:hypothetical protein